MLNIVLTTGVCVEVAVGVAETVGVKEDVAVEVKLGVAVIAARVNSAPLTGAPCTCRLLPELVPWPAKAPPVATLTE